MTEYTYKAILLGAKDYKENDKLLSLLSVEGGLITALMRGVKKPTAKLRFGAAPFAFCEYTLYKKGEFYTVTACTQLEDFFDIASDPDKYAAGCVMLETASCATGKNSCPDIFIALLKSLKLVLYGEIYPYLAAAAFVQKVIHLSGYAYGYPESADFSTVMGVLSCLNSIGTESGLQEISGKIDPRLAEKVLRKLVVNFENKFDCEIMSKGSVGVF